jgi:hypothetical protein
LRPEMVHGPWASSGVEVPDALVSMPLPLASVALALRWPDRAQQRFPGYRLAHLVAARIDMDAIEIERLGRLLGLSLGAPQEEMPRLFDEQLRRVIDGHSLGVLFAAHGSGPRHHAIRPTGYDFDADEVIAADMERWRAHYRAMPGERQMLAASIIWLFRAGADNRWLRRVPVTWHAAVALHSMKRAGVLEDWARLFALYPGW